MKNSQKATSLRTIGLYCKHVFLQRGVTNNEQRKVGNVFYMLPFQIKSKYAKSHYSSHCTLLSAEHDISYLSPDWALMTLSCTDVHLLQIFQAGVKHETQSSLDTVWSLWGKENNTSSQGFLQILVSASFHSHT